MVAVDSNRPLLADPSSLLLYSLVLLGASVCLSQEPWESDVMESESDFGGNSEDEEDDEYAKAFDRAEDTPHGDEDGDEDGDGDGDGGGAGYGGKGSGDINGEDVTFSDSAIPVRPRRKVGRQ